MDESPRQPPPTGIAKWISRGAGVLLLSIACNILLVHLQWRGETQYFERVRDGEIRLLRQLGSESLHQRAGEMAELPERFAADSGMDAWLITLARDPFAAPLLRDLWPAYQTLLLSLQIIAVRATILVHSLPLLILALALGIIDGATAWYLRRLEGGRESAFIYHRAKRALLYGTSLLLAGYLLAPLLLDPRWSLPPIILFATLAARTAASKFKKYI